MAPDVSIAIGSSPSYPNVSLPDAELEAWSSCPWIDSDFSAPGVQEHDSQLSFLHGTLSAYDRVVTHGGQVRYYEGLRGELAGIIEAHAAERFR